MTDLAIPDLALGGLVAVAAAVPGSRQQPDFEDSDFRDAKCHRSGHKKSWLSEIFD